MRRVASLVSGSRAAAVAVAALALIASLPGPSAAVPFELDPAHTAASFSIRHIFTMVPGRFEKMSAKIDFDAAAPEKSTAEFTIDAASVNTGVEKRDAHLRSADFFNVEKFPTLTFKSTKVEKTDSPNILKITGDFTMIGVTKPLTVQAEVLGVGPDGFGNIKGGFQVTGTINRKDFGLTWNKTLDTGGTLLGDEVKFTVSIEAVQKAS